MTDSRRAESGEGRRKRKPRGPRDAGERETALEVGTPEGIAPAALVSAGPLTAELTRPRFLSFVAAIAIATGLYVTGALGPGSKPVLLIALGALGFGCGASSGMSPGRIVLGSGALVAAALAIAATRSSEVAIATCMSAGLALAGGIHRLGRLGPDEGVA